MKTEIEESLVHHTLAEAEQFHPRLRPGYPKLIIVDDGETDQGEVIRIRSEKLTIGRQGCDLNFPAERLMSSFHCAITLESGMGGQWHWILRDNGSRHGLFLRLQEFNVSSRNEWLAGGTRFLLAGATIDNPKVSEANYVCFVNREANAAETLIASGYNFTFNCSIALRKKLAIGAVAHPPSVAIPDFQLEPEHFTLRYIEQNSWHVVDSKTQNGTWLRIRELAIRSSCSFIAGEQRFILVLDSSESNSNGR